MEEKQTDIGVIIGRFQVHELHLAHMALIETVLQNHTKVILFLGTSTAIATRKNPLDFKAGFNPETDWKIIHTYLIT